MADIQFTEIHSRVERCQRLHIYFARASSLSGTGGRVWLRILGRIQIRSEFVAIQPHLRLQSGAEFLMESVDAVGILRDCLLPKICSFPEDGWMRAFLDPESELALLSRLATTCTEWQNTFFASVQYSALRLAMAHFLEQSPWDFSQGSSQRRKQQMEFVAFKYEQASYYLSRLWTLQVDVEDRIRTASLANLSLQELQMLRLKLQEGWGAVELKPARREKLKASSRTWITPAQRAP